MGAPRDRRRLATKSFLSLLLLAVAIHGFDMEEEEQEAARGDSCRAGQFKCLVDGRCLPGEWRCDFSEQCLDGQDEFGCLLERCDFGHDLCQWRNQAGGGSAWLRYISAPNASSWKTSLGATQAGRQKQQDTRLRELHGRLARPQRFLFASLAAGPQRRQARLVAPQLGQTNSPCQLRFRYALLPAASLDAAATTTTKDTTQATLQLVARRPPGEEEGRSGSRIVWQASSTLSSASSPPLNDGARWRVGVAELGHLSRVELEFEARLDGSRSSTNGSSGQQQLALVALAELHFKDCAWPQTLLPADSLEGDVQVFTTPTSSSSLSSEEEDDLDVDVATATSQQVAAAGQQCAPGQFRCRASGLCLDRRKLCNFVDDCMATGDNEVNRAAPDGGEEADGDVGGDEIELETEMALEASEDERAAVCAQVAGREHFEGATPTMRPAASAASQDQPDVWRLLMSGLAAVAGSEGVSVPAAPKLVKSLTKMHEAEKTIKMKRRNSNWALASNLDESAISVVKPHQGESLSPPPAHLPQRDHTTRSERGHYLSLDISQQADMKKEMIWVYLDSVWLEKRNEDNEDDCRLKFFYNLVTEANDKATSRHYRVYLAIEHLALVRNGSRVLGTRRKLHRLVHSRLSAPMDGEDDQATRSPEEEESLVPEESESGSDIEHVGVDFWREANYQVVGVAPNEPYYLRVVAIIRPTKGVRYRASLNFDDLATHHGCGRPLSAEQQEQLDKFRQYRDNLTVSLSLADYATTTPSRHNSHLKRRQLDSLNCPVQYEPHKLIMCVLAVLASMLGLILMIVFVIVPYVERITISYHDQLAMGISTMDSTPRNSTPNLLEACELTNDSDWEQVSRRWRRNHNQQTHHNNNNNYIVESISTSLLDSRTQSTGGGHRGDSSPTNSFNLLDENDSILEAPNDNSNRNDNTDAWI